LGQNRFQRPRNLYVKWNKPGTEKESSAWYHSYVESKKDIIKVESSGGSGE
jgi:hypothetical protein